MRSELEEIKKIRENNNTLWLGIVDIALRFAPEETKKLLEEIRLNDIMVSEYVGDIVDEGTTFKP